MSKKHFSEFLTVFLSGGFIYGLIEILFRSFTHPSMFAAGGICFTLLYYINLKIKSRSLILRGLIGSAIITLTEFIFGVIFNIALGMQVWDYSDKPFNVMGQICPQFSLIWFIFSLPLIYISVFIFHRLNKRLSLFQES